jgi:uncharacterized membrane protein
VLIRPTRATQFGVVAMMAVIAATTAFLATQYGGLPDLLPVHFDAHGLPIGWQFKTWSRVLMPAFVESALFFSLAGIAALLLWRRERPAFPYPADVRAARTTAEAVVLIALLWVAVQLGAAVALAAVWRANGGLLDWWYLRLEGVGLLLTIAAGAQALWRVGRPEPLPYIAAHWRFGQLYCNREHPALFVPTRDGSRWTLNFGRPVAAVLLGVILVAGIALPVLILALALRA